MDLLQHTQARANGSPWLFPSPRQGKHRSVEALDRYLREALPHLGIQDFRAHDLRRTAASHMTGAGVPRLVVAKILNHAESGVTAVYDRYSYDREKREALELWANHLGEIVRGE